MEDRHESTNWACVLQCRITIKRSTQRCGLIFLLFPCDLSGTRSLQREGFFMSKWEPEPNLLLRQQRPEAGSQGQISSQPRQMGSLWLHGPLSTDRNEVEQASLTSQGKDLAVFENWGGVSGPSHTVSVWNKLSLTRFKKDHFQMNNWAHYSLLS